LTATKTAAIGRGIVEETKNHGEQTVFVRPNVSRRRAGEEVAISEFRVAFEIGFANGRP